MHRLGCLCGEQKEPSSSKSRGCLLLVVVIKMYPIFLFCLLLHVVLTFIFCKGLVCCLTGFYQPNRDDDEARYYLLDTRHLHVILFIYIYFFLIYTDICHITHF